MQFTMRGKHRAALRELRRNDAVEEIDPAMDRFENIERRADPHEIAGTVFRQLLRDDAGKLVTLRGCFTHGEPANGQPVKRQIAQERRAYFSQIRMTRALHDT